LPSEVRIVRCERGPEPHRRPAHGEWEACFTFVVSPAPEDDWTKLFHENLGRVGINSVIWHLSIGGARLRGQRVSFFCHPDRLQVHADALKAVVEDTNVHWRDKATSGDEIEARRREFERMVDAAIDAVEL